MDLYFHPDMPFKRKSFIYDWDRRVPLHGYEMARRARVTTPVKTYEDQINQDFDELNKILDKKTDEQIEAAFKRLGHIVKKESEVEG